MLPRRFGMGLFDPNLTIKSPAGLAVDRRASMGLRAYRSTLTAICGEQFLCFQRRPGRFHHRVH